MSKPDHRKLVCTACKHENEPERVYCHNCGEKLDRSLLPKIEESPSEENLSKKKRQVHRMMNPNRFRLLVTMRKFLLIVGFSALVAAIFLACLAPEDAPPMKTDEIAGVDSMALWRTMMQDSNPAVVMFKESDINYSMRRSVKPGSGPLGIKFQRAFVTLKPGAITLNTQREAWGLPIHTGATLKPVIVDGKWSPGIIGLSVGRLKIHPAAGRLGGFALEPFAKAFEAEAKQLDRLARIEAGDKAVIFATKAAR